MCRFAYVPLLFVLGSCSPTPKVLAPTPPGNGPMVKWDLRHKPLPEIPFPNNVATRSDPSSPTGIRLNLSTLAPTELEKEIRDRADRLDGFGVFAPITVSFDKPIDVNALLAVHRDREFSNDAVFVFDVTPSSPSFGQPVMLDMGRGFFPVTLVQTDAYFPYDPRASGSNLLFETESEKEGEDTDFDGVRDVPNTLDEDGDPFDNLLTFYERETNTLILRPVVPLRERTTYAVVITRRVVGLDGEPVRSPFPYVHHNDQGELLAPLEQILPKFGLSVRDIAFAWAFTTQSTASVLFAIREGLHGRGPFARLAREFRPIYRPVAVKSEAKALETGSASVIWTNELMEIVEPLLPMLKGFIPSLKESVDALIESFRYVDFIFAGEFESPNFLVDRDGIATVNHPADDDEIFEINPLTGEAIYSKAVVPFLCVVPKALPQTVNGKGKPFDVTIFMHGTASSKMHALGYAGVFARLGIATCAIDAFAHGTPFPANPPEGSLVSEELVLDLIKRLAPDYVPVYDFIKGKRARDINMDGNLDPAGDFWTFDALHTRDTVRQTVVDLLQFTRILRAMEGRADVDGDGVDEILGDLDGDGVQDIGGRDARLSAWGISLGGIVTGVFAGVEPALDAAVIQSGGGGLADIAVRSFQPGVPENAILPVFGTLFMFEHDGDGLLVRQALPSIDHVEYPVVARLNTTNGMLVLRNLDTGEEKKAKIPALSKGKGFRLGIQADAMRATEIRALLGFDPMHPVGGEPCKVQEDCPAPLGCVLGECTCSGFSCPLGFRCKENGKCAFSGFPLAKEDIGTRYPLLGDRIQVEVRDEKGEITEVVDRFGQDVYANGVIYPKDSPLVALYRGFGYQRQTPSFRRFLGIAQTLLDPGDPVAFARHYIAEPFYDPDGETPGTSVIFALVAGDTNVPIATGIALARAAGIVGFDVPDGRFGEKSQMDVLIEKGVVEGLFNRCRHSIRAKDKNGMEHEYCVVYDPDDMDESRHFSGCACKLKYDGETVVGWVCKDEQGEICGDGFGIPFDLKEPLRLTVTSDAGVIRKADCKVFHDDGVCKVFETSGMLGALRVFVTEPQGFHGLYLMAPYKPFDVETYQLNLFAHFFASGGHTLIDDKCLANLEAQCGSGLQE